MSDAARKNKWSAVKEANMQAAQETLDRFLNDERLTLVKESLSSMHVPRQSGGIVLPYNGMYGEGYAVHIPSWDGRRYSRVYYFIFKQQKG
jgi:hypothetical protein